MQAPDEPRTDYDGSTPLPDPLAERFVALLAQIGNATESYVGAKEGKIPRNSARVRASELMRRQDVRARLAVLRSQRPTACSPTPGQMPREAPPADVNDSSLAPQTPEEWRSEILRVCARAMRSSTLDSASISAASQVAKLLRLDELRDKDADQIPDPCAIIDYITQTAGRPHAVIAKELGGLPWILARVQTLTHATLPAMRRALAEMEKAAEGQHAEAPTPDETHP